MKAGPLRLAGALGLLAAALLLADGARADSVPSGFQWKSDTTAYLLAGGHVVTVEGMFLTQNTPVTLPPTTLSPPTIDSFFDVFVQVSIDGGPTVPLLGASGTETLQFKNSGPVVGGVAYDTEMIALDISGSAGGHSLHIMQVPSSSSTGTSLVPTGGSFPATSFFDVFTELSLDGGAFSPGLTPTHFSGSTPLPQASLAGAALLLCFGVARRLRNRRNALN